MSLRRSSNKEVGSARPQGCPPGGWARPPHPAQVVLGAVRVDEGEVAVDPVRPALAHLDPDTVVAVAQGSVPDAGTITEGATGRGAGAAKLGSTT